MNKEKLICCSAAILLASAALVIVLAEADPQSSLRPVYARLFGCVPTERLVREAPLTVVAPPAAYHPSGTPQDVDVCDGIGNRPFGPERNQVAVTIEPSDPPPPRIGWWREARRFAVVRWPPQPDKSIGKLDGSVQVAYMGVMDAYGQRLGMLRANNGRFLNVREGDRLKDLGCTIIRIEKEAIHLMTRTGVYHILGKTGS
jgi:hypothetical protein